MLSHYNNGCNNAPQCYVIRIHYLHCITTKSHTDCPGTEPRPPRSETGLKTKINLYNPVNLMQYWYLTDVCSEIDTEHKYTVCAQRNFFRLNLVVKVKLKVKQSHYRSGQGLRVPEDLDSQISRQSAHEGGKVVSPTHRPPLPPRIYSWYSFLLETEPTPRPQCGRKDYVNEKFH